MLLAENALSSGDLTDAARWLNSASIIIAGDRVATQQSEAAYFVAAATLALYEGRLDDAEALLAQSDGRYAVLTTPRLRAVHLSLMLRIQGARGPAAINQAYRSELARLYERSGELGGNDGVVEALWLAEILCGTSTKASELLYHYLRERRRETTTPEWGFRVTTAADPAWIDNASAALRQIPNDETPAT
jgi:hypothetical protein